MANSHKNAGTSGIVAAQASDAHSGWPMKRGEWVLSVELLFFSPNHELRLTSHEQIAGSFHLAQ